MENRLHKRVTLERREKIEMSPTVFQFLLPAELPGCKAGRGNQTEPGGLPGLRKAVESPWRTEELEFIGQKTGEERAIEQRALEINRGFPLSVQQCTDQNVPVRNCPKLRKGLS